MKKAVFAVVMLCLAAAPVWATTGPLSVTSSSDCTTLGGGTLFASLLGQVTFNGTNPAGTVDSCAFSGVAANPAVSGGDANALTFVYQFHQVTGSDISSFTVSPFGTSNLGIGSFGSGHPVFTVDNSVLNAPTWLYSPKFVGAGDTAFMFVFTNLDSVTTGIANLNDNSNSRADVLVPTPEPASMALLGMGALAIGGFLRRKLGK